MSEENVRRVYDWLMANPGTVVVEISEGTGLMAMDVEVALRVLTEREKVQSTSTGRYSPR